MPAVLALTLVFGFALAAVSYALVESPCREAFRRWEYRHQRPVPPPDWGHRPLAGDAITDEPEPEPEPALR
jgi:acetyltransferase